MRDDPDMGSSGLADSRGIAPPARSWRDRPWMRFALVVLVLGMAWLAGLVRFAADIPAPTTMAAVDPLPTTPSQGQTDGIVVLTGGSGRIDAGLALLSAGLGRALLVSGVGGSGAPPSLAAMATEAPGLHQCCLSIGRARDTRANATETAAWMTERGFRSVRLVTASYHMPRSLWEFRHVMPDVTILPHPIGPLGFVHDGWWYRSQSLRIVLMEYHKFLAAWLRRRLESVAP